MSGHQLALATLQVQLATSKERGLIMDFSFEMKAEVGKMNYSYFQYFVSMDISLSTVNLLPEGRQQMLILARATMYSIWYE